MTQYANLFFDQLRAAVERLGGPLRFSRRYRGRHRAVFTARTGGADIFTTVRYNPDRYMVSVELGYSRTPVADPDDLRLLFAFDAVGGVPAGRVPISFLWQNDCESWEIGREPLDPTDDLPGALRAAINVMNAMERLRPQPGDFVAWAGSDAARGEERVRLVAGHIAYTIGRYLPVFMERVEAVRDVQRP